MKLKSLVALFSLVSLAANATDINFTYNTENAKYKVYGFDKKETYDIALKIEDPAYINSQVTGITVNIPVGNPAIKELSAWLSSELRVENKLNSPDICSQAGEINHEVLNVTFDTPYTITADGVWVGYSFTITDLSEEYNYPGKPIACIESEENLDKGLWVHSSRSRLQWVNLGSTVGIVSTMIVHLSTDFGPYDVALVLPEQSYVVRDEISSIPVTLINHGTNPLEEITYSYTVSDKKMTGTTKLDTPIGALGERAETNISIEALPELGEFPLTVTLETSNGQANNDPQRSAKGNLNVWPVIPVTRPLIEEYTGLGCGYCPRGYVAMEEMKKTLGDMFVGLAYHTQTYETAMVTVADNDFPVKISGFPSADINRQIILDPGYLPFRWAQYAAEIVPAEITVTAEWSEDKTSINATATVNFVKDMEDTNYRLSFALVADGLHDDKWKQSNYYAGDETGDGIDSELWDIFLNGGSKVSGLIYNDVVAYYKDIQGIQGSIPQQITADSPITYDYSIPIDDVKTINGKDFLCEGATLHVVAILLDGNTGYSVNCNKSKDISYDLSGVSAVTEDTEVTGVEYYNLHGVRVDNPQSVCIKMEYLSNGTRRTSKIIKK